MLEKLHPGMEKFWSPNFDRKSSALQAPFVDGIGIEDDAVLGGNLSGVEPSWTLFWKLVPHQVRIQITNGTLAGQEAILKCVEKSGTVIKDMDHPLAKCLPQEQQELLRNGTGRITIGMSNGYRIVTRKGS
jgi:hypothetical protein